MTLLSHLGPQTHKSCSKVSFIIPNCQLLLGPEEDAETGPSLLLWDAKRSKRRLWSCGNCILPHWRRCCRWICPFDHFRDRSSQENGGEVLSKGVDAGSEWNLLNALMTITLILSCGFRSSSGAEPRLKADSAVPQPRNHPSLSQRPEIGNGGRSVFINCKTD